MESSGSRRALDQGEAQDGQSSASAGAGHQQGAGPIPPSGADPAELYRHMAEMFRHMAHTVPPTRKPILERLAKIKTVEFYGRNEDDAVAAEFWLDRTQRVLEQLEATSEEGYAAAVSLL